MAALDAGAGSLSDEDYLAGIARAVFERVEADDTFLRLLLHSALEGHALARDFRRARIDRVRAEVESLVRRRSLRLGHGGGIEPELAARLFTGLIMAVLLQRHVFREPKARRMASARLAGAMARLLVHGLRGGEAHR